MLISLECLLLHVLLQLIVSLQSQKPSAFCLQVFNNDCKFHFPVHLQACIAVGYNRQINILLAVISYKFISNEFNAAQC